MGGNVDPMESTTDATANSNEVITFFILYLNILNHCPFLSDHDDARWKDNDDGEGWGSEDWDDPSSNHLKDPSAIPPPTHSSSKAKTTTKNESKSKDEFNEWKELENSAWEVLSKDK
uniref:Uncharacterized protein n=1 Tax=Lepeophtheirus salmonis TaxID=72036 RepID=A0A0K2U0W9_LEPSM